MKNYDKVFASKTYGSVISSGMYHVIWDWVQYPILGSSIVFF